ncbi:hypothetical protein [Zavarzinia sp.]|uniref:hypothetical protein n=1 Tax=Zavarzinia sp. TaxID=2027920 RepID=UPI003BB62707
MPSSNGLLDINFPDCLKLEQILMQTVQIFGTKAAVGAQAIVRPWKIQDIRAARVLERWELWLSKAIYKILKSGRLDINVEVRPWHGACWIIRHRPMAGISGTG